MRVALALDPPLEEAVLDPECERAARATASLLESLGHTVEEISPRWSNLGLLPDFTRAFGPLVSLATMVGGEIAGREPAESDVEPLTWALWERARTQSTLGYLAAQARLESAARTLVTWFAPYDAVLTPSLARRPVAIGEIHGRGPDPWKHYQRSGSFTPYTAIINITGLPAVSLPLHHGEDGLPTGVQLIGRPAQEGPLLALSAQIERAQPWSARRPPVESLVSPAGA